MSAFDQFIASPFQALGQPKKYKLKYLSDEAKIFFQKGIKLYQGCHSISQEQYPSWKELKQKSEEVLRIANERNDFSILKQISELMKNKLRYEKSLKWYNDCNKMLQEEETWSRYKQNIGNDQTKLRKLEKLHQEWEYHGELSHYTSSALLFAADVLEDLEFHLSSALKEYNRYSRYKKEIVISDKDYGVYLQVFLQEVLRQKKVVCEAMYARWRLALENQDMTNDDVTVNLMEQLNQLGITQDNTWFKRQRPSQTQEYNEKLFIKFHHYIAHHGTSGLMKLTDVSLVISKSQEQAEFENVKSLILIDNPKNAFFIPDSLKKLTPLNYKRPHFLFKGHNFRHAFFQDKQNLLLKFVQLFNIKIHVSSYKNLTNDPLWMQLQDTQNSIVSHLDLVNGQFTRGFFARYKQASNQLLGEWRQLLLEQQKQVILRQISFLEEFVNHPPFLEHDFEEPVFEESAVQEIKSLFNNIRNNFIKIGLNDINRLDVLDNKLTDLFQKDDDLRIQKDKILTIKAGLKQLMDGRSVDFVQFALILQYYHEVSISKIAEISLQDISIVRTIGQHLIDFLKNQPSDLKNLKSEQFITWVEQCNSVVDQYKDEETLKAVEQVIRKFLDRYRSFLTHPDNQLEKMNELCIGLEILVAKIAPEYSDQVRGLKSGREWLMKGNSLNSPSTFGTLTMLFNSSKSVDINNTVTLTLDNGAGKLAEQEELELQQRLESKALCKEIECMISNRASSEKSQQECLTAKKTSELTSLPPKTQITSESTSILRPELLAICNLNLQKGLQEWDDRQQQHQRNDCVPSMPSQPNR